MKAEHVINVQGNDFIKYEGLLDEAHQQGLKRIQTTLIQIPHPDNGNVAICSAEVETEKGTFSGIGDASAGNVGRMIAPHIIRMSETRAKARALRDAVNIGTTALEELGDFENLKGDGAHLLNEPEPYRSDVPKASPYKPASANQLATATKLSRLLGREMPQEEMNGAEASDLITELSREYNERKGSGRHSAPKDENPFSEPAPSADGPAVQVMEDGRRVNTETGERLEDNPFDGQGVHDQNQDPNPTLALAKDELKKALSGYEAFHHVGRKDAYQAVFAQIRVPEKASDWTVSHYTALTIWLNSASRPEPAREPERTVVEV